MKKILFLFLGGTTLLMAQANPLKMATSNYFITSSSLNQEGALALLFRANMLAEGYNKNSCGRSGFSREYYTPDVR